MHTNPSTPRSSWELEIEHEIQRLKSAPRPRGPRIMVAVALAIPALTAAAALVGQHASGIQNVLAWLVGAGAVVIAAAFLMPPAAPRC